MLERTLFIVKPDWAEAAPNWVIPSVNGASILVAEHKTDLLAGVATRVVALEAGRIVLDGSAGDVLADPQLRELGVAEPAATRLLRLARESELGEAAQRRLATVVTVAT